MATHRFGWALSGFTARARGAPFVSGYILSEHAFSGLTLHAFRLVAGTGRDCLLYDIIGHIKRSRNVHNRPYDQFGLSFHYTHDPFDHLHDVMGILE